jgi:hypothetical protein
MARHVAKLSVYNFCGETVVRRTGIELFTNYVIHIHALSPNTEIRESNIY